MSPVDPAKTPARRAAGAASASPTGRDGRTVSRAWVANAAPRLGVTEATIRRWIRSGQLNPSCREVYSKVFPYLDRELSPAELAEVERHIAACPGCEEHFAMDGSVLRFIQLRAPKPLCPPAVQERLLARFRGR